MLNLTYLLKKHKIQPTERRGKVKKIKISEELYLYIYNNKIYFLDHEINIKEEKTLEKILKKECFSYDFIFEKKHYKRIKSFLFSMFFLSLCFPVGIKCQQEISQFSKCQTFQKKFETLIENQLNQDSFLLVLNKLEELLKEKDLPEEMYNDIVNKVLLNQYPSQTEGFKEMAQICININPNFTDEEKSMLKEEVTKKIDVYGEYYEGKRLLISLIEYAKVEVSRKENISIATFTQDRPYGLITYNPNWEDKNIILHHELCHAELMGESNKPIYNESRAAFLSHQGYPSTRAFLTFLGMLGDEEEVLKALINNHSNKIWENISQNIKEENIYILEYLKGFTESIRDPGKLENEFQTDQQISSLLTKLYFDKNSHHYSSNMACILLLEILKEGEKQYSTENNLILNGTFPVNLHAINKTREVFIPLESIYRASDLENEKLLLLIDYLKEELKSDTEYTETACYAIETLLGTKTFTYLLNSDTPLEILNESNAEKYELGFPEIWTEEIEKMIRFAQNGNISALMQTETFQQLIYGNDYINNSKLILNKN